jgi:integrase
MYADPTLDGAKQMDAMIPLRQSPFWAKRENQPPVRQPNQASRTREYLTPDEVESMITAARRAGRLAGRDALLIMMAYRHGLRASELISLR